jgi:hypothetical protein
VSEALYLRDPDGNGVELYWGSAAGRMTAQARWLAMYTRPLDRDGRTNRPPFSVVASSLYGFRPVAQPPSRYVASALTMSVSRPILRRNKAGRRNGQRWIFGKAEGPTARLFFRRQIPQFERWLLPGRFVFTRQISHYPSKMRESQFDREPIPRAMQNVTQINLICNLFSCGQRKVTNDR